MKHSPELGPRATKPECSILGKISGKKKGVVALEEEKGKEEDKEMDEVVKLPDKRGYPSSIQITVLKEEIKKVVLLCSCGRECDQNPDSTYKNKCEHCLEGMRCAVCNGYLYEKDSKDPLKLKRYWYRLIGNSLYSKMEKSLFIPIEYADKGVAEPESMQALTGAVIKDEGEVAIQKDTTLSSFVLILGMNPLRFYTVKIEEKQRWLRCIKDALGYCLFSDYYVLKVNWA